METYTLSGLDFSPELNMARYLQSIRRYPVLDQEEEQSLAKTYRLTKDQQIANRLILSQFALLVNPIDKFFPAKNRAAPLRGRPNTVMPVFSAR